MSLFDRPEYIRPEYIFRPKQIFLRILREYISPVNNIQEVVLPWGVKVRINIQEDIGRSIWRHGVHELIVCEAICRTLNEGEVGLDVGSNIGQMTGLMSLRVGNSGSVLSFEPHPDVYKTLKFNTDKLANKIHKDVTKIYNIALSEKKGSLFFSPLTILN